MSTHYASSHYRASHQASSHFGGLIVPPPIIEEGGGSGGKRTRRPADGHGAFIPTVRLPRDIAPGTEYDDADLALLAVMLIQEFYD